MERQLNAYLRKTISIRDTAVRTAKKENFYHGILLRLLSHREDWVVTSNVESGDGYSDILVELEEDGIGIVIEVKYAENGDFEKGCREAMEQIERMGYGDLLLEEGMEQILKYGIALSLLHILHTERQFQTIGFQQFLVGKNFSRRAITDNFSVCH